MLNLDIVRRACWALSGWLLFCLLSFFLYSFARSAPLEPMAYPNLASAGDNAAAIIEEFGTDR
jgi:hypothetical protein